MNLGKDRRSLDRAWLLKNAVLAIPGRAAWHHCCVRDLTDRGIGIKLNGLKLLPTEFALSFDGCSTMRACRLVWRDGDFVGVAYIVGTD